MIPDSFAIKVKGAKSATMTMLAPPTLLLVP